MAVPDSICTNRAVSVSEVGLLVDPQQAASTMAHMIGHTLGLTHEPGEGSNPKTHMWSQCWFNVGPASATLVQHQTSIESMYRVSWEIANMVHL